MRGGANDRLALITFGQGGRYAVPRDRPEPIAFRQPKEAELGLADSGRVREHRLEHWLQLARRTADDLQDLRGRSLLLQCFAHIVGALAQLAEQPRILDRDDGLI